MESILSQLADSVAKARDLEELTRPLLELLEAVTGLESTYLTSIDMGRGVQNILFSRNTRELQIPEGLSVPWGETLCKRALEEDRPCTDEVESVWGDSAPAKALGIRTYLSQAVRTADGMLFGTLCAASGRQVSVSTQTVKVLGLFARLIAQQVERERILQGLRKSNAELSAHAMTDPLTGVANRRGLVLELQRMLDQARRDHHSVQVAFIDLDGFKAINDQYGHEAGDQFLVQIARRLAGSIRSSDFIARYGGDEFVVVASNANTDDLRQRLERLIAGRYVNNNQVIQYGGASVGITTSTPEDHDVETLLSRADAAMYACKRSRREQEAERQAAPVFGAW